MGSAAVIEGRPCDISKLLLTFLAVLSVHCLPQVCRAIPDGVPTHLLTDNCTAANAEYNSKQPPGSFYYYLGTPDSYCSLQQLSSSSTASSAGWKICGASSAPACTTAIAPYSTKADACKGFIYSTSPSRGYGTSCSNSVRVFFINFDLDCDWVIICEYFDGPVVVTPGTLSPGAPPPAKVTTAPTLAPPIPSAAAPAPLLPPSPSLLPKAGDIVISSAYAVGTVEYTCNKASGLFSNESMSATLYSTPLGNSTVGMYQKANGSQVFALADGSRAVVGPRDTGNSYAQNPNVLLDGGYGSLNQSYTTATGNASLATVAYVTITATVGGVLPSKAPCTKVPGSQISYPPWSIPFEANITFLSRFTPPL